MLKFQVPFDEGDVEGIVFFGNYFRLAHRALESWLPTAGIPWKEWFKNDEWGVPLRHVEAEYLKPLRPGDMYEARVWVKEIGESSIHFGYEFVNEKGEPLARLKTSHVCVTRPDMKKHKVPENIRARLQPHLKK
jgi:YbgC/YbaW family acyl-CoA thioester hydrolase